MFDVWENLGMLAVVNNPFISQPDLSALHIRDMALTKWILVFVAMALLAIPLKGLTKQLDRVSILFTLTAATGAIAILHKPFLGSLLPLPMLAGLIMLAYYSLRSPASFLETDYN